MYGGLIGLISVFTDIVILKYDIARDIHFDVHRCGAKSYTTPFNRRSETISHTRCLDIQY